METTKFVYDESRYIPTDVSFSQIFTDAYRAGKIVRDF
jgi:hypothetical protein